MLCCKAPVGRGRRAPPSDVLRVDLTLLANAMNKWKSILCALQQSTRLTHRFRASPGGDIGEARGICDAAVNGRFLEGTPNVMILQSHASRGMDAGMAAVKAGTFGSGFWLWRGRAEVGSAGIAIRPPNGVQISAFRAVYHPEHRDPSSHDCALL